MPGDQSSLPQGQQAPSVDGANGPMAHAPVRLHSVNSNQDAEVKVTFTAKFCYYTVGFIAYWFGSSRFDMDGDGDFDAADVQQIMDKGREHLRQNFSRSPQDKEALKKRKAALERKKTMKVALERKKTMAQKQAAEQRRSSPRSSPRSVDGAAGGEDNVEQMDTDEEEEIIQNLKQRLPWFTIHQVSLILVLWGAFAGREYPYSLNSVYETIEDTMVLRDFTQDGTIYQAGCAQECNAEDACVGYAFREGPFSECRLLSALPGKDIGGGIDTDSKCSDSTWNWETYKKDGWDFGVWMATQGGLENLFPGQTALSSHYFCEDGFHLTFLYRWWSYQFTHGSVSHVGSNSFMTVVLGIPLEGLHGAGTFGLMWTTGVLGGAFNWALFDPYRTSFGASGGCFALLGMHVADLVMNWGQKKFRWAIVGVLCLVTGVELAGFWASHSEEGSLTAHCVHVGGLIAGLLIGVCVGRNLHVERWEKFVQFFCWATGLSLCLLGVIWWFAANPFPGVRNLWDPAERPWCWIGQACIGDNGGPCPWDVLEGNPDYFFQCIFCNTRACVEGWYGAKDVDGGFTFCPRSQAWSKCHDSFDDSWDLFFPPSKSMLQ